MDSDYYRFYLEVGEKYPEEDIVYTTLRGRLRKKFVFHYLDSLYGSILDIGCNRGMYLEKYEGGKMFGVDISLPVLHHAQTRLQKHPSHAVHLIQGDAENLSFIRRNTFDNVLCSEVLEHVYRPEKVISGIARILKKGGTVLITAPNFSKKRPQWVSTGVLKKYGIQGTKGDTYFHSAFKPDELAEMVRAAGLHVYDNGTFEKEVRYATKLPVIVYYLCDFVNKRVGNSAEIARLNEKLLDKLSSTVYAVARLTGIDALLQRFMREGVRSYVLAGKEDSSL